MRQKNQDLGTRARDPHPLLIGRIRAYDCGWKVLLSHQCEHGSSFEALDDLSYF